MTRRHVSQRIPPRPLPGPAPPQCSGGSQAAIPILAAAGIVAISGSATRTDLTTAQAPGGFFFRTAFRNDLEGIFAGQFLLSVEADRFYFVDSNEPFSIDRVDAAQACVEAAEGVLCSGCQVPLPADFLEAFIALRGRAPSATFPAQDVDAATVLLDAVQAVAEERPDGSLVIDPRAPRDAVRATDLRDGVSEAITFDAHGDRLTTPGEDLDALVAAGLAAQDADVDTALGLIPCQVQDGVLVPLGGPTAGEVRLPYGRDDSAPDREEIAG